MTIICIQQAVKLQRPGAIFSLFFLNKLGCAFNAISYLFFAVPMIQVSEHNQSL